MGSARLAVRARLTVRIIPGLLIVLGSNKNKHWVSGRAVYALQTNGDWSVIMWGWVGGSWRLGDLMQAVIEHPPASLMKTSVGEGRREGDRDQKHT